MSSDFKLPFSEQPLIMCYHNMAFPMGIIEANAKKTNQDITPWIITKFLNTTFAENHEGNTYDICLYDKWCVGDGILLHQYIEMFKYTYKELGIDICTYLSKMIKLGCYIIGMYNEKYIPGKTVYQQSDFIHDYILYGTDEKEVFYSAGYLKDKRFQSYKITFSDFMNSILHTSNERIHFGFWSYNKDCQYRYDAERVVKELSDYTKSTTTHGFQNNAVYGMEANKKLKEYFQYCFDNYDTPVIDMRFTRAYMEHKYFIFTCIQYLLANKQIDSTKVNIENVNRLYQNAVMIHRLGIKINLSKNYKIIDRILNLFEDNENIESVLLNDTVNLLK